MILPLILSTIQDANISNLFGEFAFNTAPGGSIVLLGIILLAFLAVTMWGLGITQVSAIIIGFLFLAFLHSAFGDVFTILYLAAGGIMMVLVAANLFARLARFG